MPKKLVVIEGDYSFGARGIKLKQSLKYEDLIILGH
jgi:hypothetical protein